MLVSADASVVSGALSHLRAWLRVISRRQLLIVHFDHVTGSTADALREITRHFGGPVLNHLTRLPRLNRPVLDEVRTIKCSTRSQLEQHYRPWNQRLYEHLRNDHAHSMAPPMES